MCLESKPEQVSPHENPYTRADEEPEDKSVGV